MELQVAQNTSRKNVLGGAKQNAAVCFASTAQMVLVWGPLCTYTTILPPFVPPQLELRLQSATIKLFLLIYLAIKALNYS